MASYLDRFHCLFQVVSDPESILMYRGVKCVSVALHTSFVMEQALANLYLCKALSLQLLIDIKAC